MYSWNFESCSDIFYQHAQTYIDIRQCGALKMWLAYQAEPPHPREIA